MTNRGARYRMSKSPNGEPEGPLLFFDSFTGTNGTNLTAHTPDNGTNWAVPNGTAVIQSNKLTSSVNGSFGVVAFADGLVGMSEDDYVIEVTQTINSGGTLDGIIYRGTDLNNFSLLGVNDTSNYNIFRREAGGNNNVTGGYTRTLPNVNKIHVWGPCVTAFADGQIAASVCDARLPNARLVGIRIAGNVNSATFDDFTVNKLLDKTPVERTFSSSPVIFDSDFGTDGGDPQALQVLHGLVKGGHATLLACVSSTRNAAAVNAMYGMNVYYGRGATPIGCTTRVINTAIAAWTTTMATTYGGGGPGLGAQDSVLTMRAALNGAAANSVTIISVGFMSNVADLLASGSNYGGDGILQTGIQLVQAKCAKWVVMGGAFGYIKFPQVGVDPVAIEFNFENDPTATESSINSWPASVPLYFCGYELGASSSMGTTTAIFSDNRPPWDAIAVLFGVRGGTFNGTTYFNVVGGKAWPIFTGACGFVPGAGNHYVMRDVALPAVTNAVMQSLAETPP